MTMNVLLVENDLYLSELLTEILSERNFIVEAVSNGLTPLNLVKKQHYDLIILNVKLPKLNGINLCRQLRHQGCHIPILFWTSQDAPELQQKGFKAGADDYLVKPCKISILLSHVNNLLNHKPMQPEPDLGSDRFEQKCLQVA